MIAWEPGSQHLHRELKEIGPWTPLPPGEVFCVPLPRAARCWAGRAFVPVRLAAGFRRRGQTALGTVPLQPDIEPLVRLLEETPRERLLEEVGGTGTPGSELPARSSPPCCWPGCGTSSRGPRSGSSSMRCWSSTRCIWPACRPPMPTAGCRCSGRSTTSRTRRPATCRKAAGG